MSLEDYAKLVAGLQETLRTLQKAVETLTLQLARRDEENAQLKRKLYGRSSEKMPPKEREINKEDDPGKRKARTKKRRESAAAKKRDLPHVEVVHELAAEQEVCESCSGPFRDLGDGEVSSEVEYVPARFVKRRHVRKKRVCRCGETIVVAPAPNRVADGVHYGPGLHAHAAVSKCADGMPLYRQSKKLEREGVEISPSTLGDLFHRTAQVCKPLYDLLVEEVASSGRVNADETFIRVQAGGGKTRRAYIWTFIGAGHVVFRYSPTRSGDTPKSVLGANQGFLQVDAYSGYNHVCMPNGWTRVGCLAHVRRYFFEAQETAPETAKEGMERILALYRVEHEAAESGIRGTEAHRALRQRRAKPLMASFHTWLSEQSGNFPPKSPMGKAIAYALKVWPHLQVYLDHAALSPDNNQAEGALRAVAVGRKNFLFVGNDQAGQNLAILQTIVATCRAHNVNPEAYIADVLIRIQTHPKSRERELLPDQWGRRFNG